jgi:hypothetical protein
MRGLQDGIELVWKLKFAADGLALVPLVRAVQKLELLRSLRQPNHLFAPPAASIKFANCCPSLDVFRRQVAATLSLVDELAASIVLLWPLL